MSENIATAKFRFAHPNERREYTFLSFQIGEETLLGIIGICSCKDFSQSKTIYFGLIRFQAHDHVSKFIHIGPKKGKPI